MKAYDMSRYKRVIGTDGRISGSWVVLQGRQPRDGEQQEYIVSPIDVTIYDESRSFGRVLYPSDLTAWVCEDGSVSLAKHGIAERIRPEVEEVWDEMVELLGRIAQAFIEGPREPVPASPDYGSDQ